MVTYTPTKLLPMVKFVTVLIAWDPADAANFRQIPIPVSLSYRSSGRTGIAGPRRRSTPQRLKTRDWCKRIAGHPCYRLRADGDIGLFRSKRVMSLMSPIYLPVGRTGLSASCSSYHVRAASDLARSRMFARRHDFAGKPNRVLVLLGLMPGRLAGLRILIHRLRTAFSMKNGKTFSPAGSAATDHAQI